MYEIACFCFRSLRPAARNLLESFFRREEVAKSCSNYHRGILLKTARGGRIFLLDTIREKKITETGRTIFNSAFQSLPSLMLEYVRTGNPLRIEAVSFSKREQLVFWRSSWFQGLALKCNCRWVWSICEEVFLGCSLARLNLQKPARGLLM